MAKAVKVVVALGVRRETRFETPVYLRDGKGSMEKT